MNLLTWFIFQYGQWLMKPPGSHRLGSHPMLSLHAPELLLDFGRRRHLRLGGRVCPHLPALGESAQAGELPFESESGRC